MSAPLQSLADALRAVADAHDAYDALADEQLAQACFVGLSSWTRGNLRAWAEQADALTAERDQLRVEVEQLRGAVHRVEALLGHARLVSPSRSMTVYAADVEAAIAGTTSPTQPSTETK